MYSLKGGDMMNDKFKSSVVKLYFLAGYDGGKEIKITKTYGNLNETATLEVVEAFKNGVVALMDLQLLGTDVIITKTI